MLWRSLKLFKRSEGQATVIFAAAMVAFMGFAATVMDVGRLYVARQRLQDTVDIAALAAAQDLPDTAKARTTATSYLTRNGTKQPVTVTFPDPNTITLAASSTVNFTFARVIGFNSAAMRASGSAAAGKMGQALNYTLFSGSKTTQLLTNGQNIMVRGNSHTNKNFVANGQKITITGQCEAVTTISQTGAQLDIPHPVPNSPYVPMPDFADLVKAKAQKGGTYFVGNKTYNGIDIAVGSNIYIEGNLVINGSRFTGKGTIVATGSITFNGNGHKVNAADSVAFYSRNAGITMNGNNLTVDGILYAPNGNIMLNGNFQTVNGRVIGNTATMNGSDFTIQSSASDLWAIPSTGAKLVR